MSCPHSGRQRSCQTGWRKVRRMLGYGPARNIVRWRNQTDQLSTPVMEGWVSVKTIQTRGHHLTISSRQKHPTTRSNLAKISGISHLPSPNNFIRVPSVFLPIRRARIHSKVVGPIADLVSLVLAGEFPFVFVQLVHVGGINFQLPASRFAPNRGDTVRDSGHLYFLLLSVNILESLTNSVEGTSHFLSCQFRQTRPTIIVRHATPSRILLRTICCPALAPLVPAASATSSTVESNFRSYEDCERRKIRYRRSKAEKIELYYWLEHSSPTPFRGKEHFGVLHQ
ncbi:hypothetical protein RRG08_017677 [Elysia crispata]|uniref:Uncharacterized protein n=1 Tax=Elysia crispata TaxID=231223 RepID=A0AAE0ZCA1_9GAST|nr:hypothetical protein RRG08_017677 [Elysia crispata]